MAGGSGQYVILVIGDGLHHTGELQDADQTAAAMVAELKRTGHRIQEASFIDVAEEGMRDNLEAQE